jgi:WD40 repeat protein
MNISRTIRLFVSSTFSDLKAERNALQRDVLPRLKQLCLSKGLRFQAIDLRWGISEEAGRDNKTMRICLRELRRCQQDRPKPNFLIMLGNRYGWRPLPEIIPAALFEKLAAQLRSTHPVAAQLLQKKYRLDENAVPPVAELQPRADDESWQEQVEKPLLAALEQAAQALGLDLEKEGVTIGASATEQEIIEGALKVPDAATHVRAFFRTIDGLPNDPPPKDYVDIGDPQAKLRLDALKDRIQRHIGDRSVSRYRVSWRGNGINADDLKEFCEQVWKQLSEVVEQQIAALAKVPADELEEQAHQQFGEEHCHRFVGRGEPLERIAAYLRQGSDKPLAVIGPSGSGKSAVMARAVQAAREEKSKAQIIARYIGATPASSDLIQLLRNLVGEIRRRYPVPVATKPQYGKFGTAKPGDAEIPFEFNPLLNAFHEALQRSTAGQPLFLFLDALDQLTASHQAHALTWLPAKLSDHVRLVVSAALPPESGAGGPPVSSKTTDPRPAIMTALTSRLDAEQRVTLAPLTVADGAQMLTNWLADARRTLQEPQRKAILGTFQVEGNPLWLRTAAEEAARLHSWDPAPAFAPHVDGLMKQVLDRLSREEEHGTVLVERALGYLACARHGLAEDEVIGVLGDDTEVMGDFRRRSPKSPPVESLPVAVWARLHGDLAFYLAEHQAQEASLLGFYHRSFLEAVTAHCLAFREDRQARYQRLAGWFGKQTWFLAPASEDPDVPPREARIEDPPNARKASELPWHLYKTADEFDPERWQEAVWQPLAEALCDILLVEAKVRSGQVFELQEDYRLTLDALPEMVPEVRAREEREARIKRWTAEIIAYARSWSERRDRLARGEPVPEPEPILPEPVSACRIWTQEEIEAECQRISNQPTRLDRLRAFAGFVASQCYPLIEHGKRPGFTLQHAFNCEPSGPVHGTAAVILPALQTPYFARRWPTEARPNPMPALLRTLEGYTSNVMSITPDGRRAVSGSSDKMLRMWDLESGRCLRILEGHTDRVTSVSMTPDGRRAVSGSRDEMRVWDLESGECLRTLEGYTSNVMSVTPDGRRAVSASWRVPGSADATLRVWDLQSGQCLRILEGHTDSVFSVSVTPDGRRAVSGGKNNALRVWDLESGQCLSIMEGHTKWVSSVGVTPDGRRAVSGSADATLRVWDLESGQCLCTLRDHRYAVRSVSGTPDGTRAISVSDDKTMRVWDLENGRCLRVVEGPTSWGGGSVSVTSDCRRAVSLSGGGLQVWNLESGLRLRTLEEHTSGCGSVSVTPDGRRAVSASSDTTLRVWDLASGKCLRTLKGHTGMLSSVAVTPNGRRVVSGSWDQTVRVWDLESGRCLRTMEGHVSPIYNVNVTPDGRYAISAGGNGGKDKTLRVWDLERGKCLHVLEGHTSSVESVSMTPEGRRAVSGSYDRTLRVWDLKRGKCLRVLEGHGGGVSGVSVTPDGRRAVSWGDSTPRVWDLGSGQCLRPLEGHTSRVVSVSVTPDGQRVVSGSSDGTLRVWDLETGACLGVLQGHRNWVRRVSVTPDGQCGVSGGDDYSLRVWNLGSGQCVALFRTSAPIQSFAIPLSAASVVCGTGAGEVIFLEARGIEFGPPVCTTTPVSGDAGRARLSSSRLLRLIPFFRQRP